MNIFISCIYSHKGKNRTRIRQIFTQIIHRR
jgi:hypothetical protein